MTPALQDLEALYADPQHCAKVVGLEYVASEVGGVTRKKHGRGFRYFDENNRSLQDGALKQRIAELVIPPAWQDVWICPEPTGHVLATGIDERGRKQYIYHPEWRRTRDLLKFYRMLVFARALPAIRATIDQDLASSALGRRKILGTMLWLLDSTYLRVGNERYFVENDSIGLTTLTDAHVVVAGSVSNLSFRAKSGKDQQISFDDRRIAAVLRELQAQPGTRLFRYTDAGVWHDIQAADINAYLQEITGASVHAKDFRTWGGTLLAFDELVALHRLPAAKTPKKEKAVVRAVDAAAKVLGNTRTVARSSYVHPHILATYGTKEFDRLYTVAQKKTVVKGLDTRETELTYFLEQLFSSEFNIIHT